MCGRFADYYETEELVEEFEVDLVAHAPEPSWNIAPTAQIAVVRATAPEGKPWLRELRGARWGLVPSWSKDAAGAARLINARSETVTVKPSFRAAARGRRALIPAAGYYEWQSGPSGVKTPYFLHPPQDRPVAMAGLYEWWRPPTAAGAAQSGVPGERAEALFSATVITRAATDSTGRIHDRMPLMVPREAWADWLDPDLRDPNDVRALIASLPDPELVPRRVSRAVGSVKNNGPDLIAPV
ncbi:MAG: SOS response-associated peptidase [Bifidobacteriaceae bacterium]|jgi:putative SOS response-associated peptidase YedK|nr:SOS response-associated peptidase [Bifidobacteriaceae bacterium]